jgi:hypothetical protein
VPAFEGLPLMRRRHLLNGAGKTPSPAPEALRRFVPERGEAMPAAAFGSGLTPA